MKRYSILSKTINVFGFVLLVLALPACEIGEFDDPNNPTIITENADIPYLNHLVVGTEAGMRNVLDTYYDNVGVIGREHYRFSGSDPRFVRDLLGAGNSVLDNNTFYTTNPWAARYRVIRNTNLLIEAATKANPNLVTPEQVEGYLGFAKTIQAHQLLMNHTMMYSNGIRIDVKDFDNLGPIVKDVPQQLAAIADLLNEAQVHLQNAGESFAFSLSSGFSDLFNPDEESAVGPDNFLMFNRALAARVAVYRGNYAEALTILPGSFLELNTNFKKGVYHVFGTGSGDQLNPLYFAPNSTGEIRVAHPSFAKDAEQNDDRLSKISKRKEPATQDSLRGTDDVAVYKSNTDPVPIIRNEELILIYAEAKIQTGALLEAITALNIIRQGHGLKAYGGPITQPALIDEMLRQRRYSLFFEGHRWVDMRRYNRLNELPKDRQKDDVWLAFPLPFVEGA
jgi:starch-binding outer membrane protein, SusD/RagB family